MSEPGVEEISQRLIEQLAGQLRELGGDPWLENLDRPLEATILTAPVWRIAEACLANPSQDTLIDKLIKGPPTFNYDEDQWQEARTAIRSEGVPDHVDSKLSPIDAIAADLIISRNADNI